jgi:hypothetical protein
MTAPAPLRIKQFDRALGELRLKKGTIELGNFELWLSRTSPGLRFHFALMAGPYLDLLLKGIKRVESRFSKNKGAPFGLLEEGDVVIFQTVGGTIDAVGMVDRCMYFQLSGTRSATSVIAQYQDDLQLLPDFIERKKDSTYATLIWFSELVSVSGPQVLKGDRRGWVPLGREKALPLL